MSKEAKIPVNYVDSSSDEFVERVVEWTTFYRRNIHRFIQHYLEIPLHLYQIIWMYLMSIMPIVTIIATRGCAKSFLIGLYACAECILRPGLKVVIVSKTIDQSKLIITEKIQGELMSKSPNLFREILKVEGGRQPRVVFKNGSTIKVVVGSEAARGNRANLIIYEEYRLIEEWIIAEVIQPFLIPRQAPFMMLNEYKEYTMYDFGEQMKSIYISSAGYKSEWMWNHIRKTVADMYNKKDTALFLGFDYAVTLMHQLKTKEQLIQEKERDSLAFAIEYENLMMGVSGDAFFNFNMVNKNQILQECSYPRKHEWVREKIPQRKDPSIFKTPEKLPGEKRVLSADIASVGGKNNDNSAFIITRAIPPSKGKNANKHNQWYKREMIYIETHNGATADYQAIRLKQLFSDFDCDYIVLDGKTLGISVFDKLHMSDWDDERGVEQPAFSAINDDEANSRDTNACDFKECVYLYRGSSSNNTILHSKMYTLLDQKRLSLLIDGKAGEALLKDVLGTEYRNMDYEEQEKILLPYTETSLLVHEIINLTKDSKNKDAKEIKLVEPSTGTKDRYMSLGMGNYFISEELEKELMSEKEFNWGDFNFGGSFDW